MTQITLTVGDIVGAQLALMNVSNKELPAVTAWKLAKAVRILEPEFKSYEDTRIKLVKQYGEQDEEGNWQVIREKNNDFQEEVTEVLQQEVVVDLELISLEALSEGTYKPRDLALIWFLFEEEHDESDRADPEGQ